MKICHAIVETLKKVELVSTAKLMDILLVGALRNVWIDMRRRLRKDNKKIKVQEAFGSN
jgi:hypothetical protein